MWKSLWLLGDNDWIVDAIQEGTCVAVTYRSYIREMYPDLCVPLFWSAPKDGGQNIWFLP